jgi:hypothetical protein
MSASLSGVFNTQCFTDSGEPAAGFRLYTFAPATTTQKVAFTDEAATVPHTYTSDGIGGQFIALNARGELPAPLYLSAGGYDIALKTPAGATVWTRRAEGVSESSAALAIDLADNSSATKNAGMVAFGPALNYTLDTLGAALQDTAVNLLWFCTTEAQRAAIKSKAFTDDHSALLAAALTWANGRAIYAPAGGYKLGATTLNKAGQLIFGDGIGATVFRAIDPTTHLFTVTASNVRFADLEMHGAATSATTSRFAIYTTSATPVTGLRVERVKFTGQAAGYGFTNAVKFDDSCHSGRVIDCYFERLWGNASGFGYGVLVGNCRDVIVQNCEYYGTPGRGRHAIYFSSGANRCKAISNHLEGADYEAITIYSQGAQPAVTDNVVSFNTIIGCCAGIPGISTGGISVFGHASGNQILFNTIRGSKGCGIKLDGTGVTDLFDTDIIGNQIYSPDYIGIDILAAGGGILDDNLVKDASQASVGTYANVRLVSDGTTSSKDWLCSGNRIPASATARAAFQANANTPVSTGLKFDANLVGSGTVTDYEFLGGTAFPIDGRLRYSQSYDPPSLVNGASTVSNWSVLAAAVGDVVTVSFSTQSDGHVLTGQVVGAGSVNVTLSNLSGSTANLAAGTIYIDVWKRSP